MEKLEGQPPNISSICCRFSFKYLGSAFLTHEIQISFNVSDQLIKMEILEGQPPNTGWFFLLVPPQKVLSVKDGKIPNKKVKVDLFKRKM